MALILHLYGLPGLEIRQIAGLVSDPNDGLVGDFEPPVFLQSWDCAAPGMESSTVALLTGQRSIQVICRADEREMGEGLRKVAKVFTSRTELL
jgi:hypothetical protein